MKQNFHLLAIETASNACSVALLLDNNEIIQFYELEPKVHTRILLPMVEKILKENALALSDIDVFAYGCGPGSFTGVRIASAVIQGFGFGTEKPIIPVSSLRALAQQFATHPLICAQMDARMNEIYWGLYKTNAKGIVEPVGDENLSSKEKILLPEGHWKVAEGYPCAKEVALIAKEEYKAGRTVSAEMALPVYLRNL